MQSLQQQTILNKIKQIKMNKVSIKNPTLSTILNIYFKTSTAIKNNLV